MWVALVEEVSILPGALEQSKGRDAPADQRWVVLAAPGPSRLQELTHNLQPALTPPTPSSFAGQPPGWTSPLSSV